MLVAYLSMTIKEALSSSHIGTLDAEMLLAHVLEKDRTFLIAHPEQEIVDTEIQQFLSFVERREGGEPIAYILGEKEFFGRAFLVDHRVLIPRPATERLVEIALQFLESPRPSMQEIDSGIVAVARVLRDTEPVTIVDIGTGSGCIAITLQREGRAEKMIGVDTSEDALSVARSNAEVWNANVKWVCMDGAEFVRSRKEPFFVISNPPYIPEGTVLDDTVQMYEPHSALFAGRNGTDVLRPLINACEEHPLCTGYVMEMREDQPASG